MLYKSSLCFGLALAVTVGCNSSSSLPTVPVTGQVLLDGIPVSGAEIVFMNKDRREGKPASAITDEQGNFKLTTYLNAKERPEGALPGDYDVVFKKLEVLAGTAEEMGGIGNLQTMPQGNIEAARKARQQATKDMLATGKRDSEAVAQMPTTEIGMYGEPLPKNLLPERYSKAETSGFAVTVQEGVEPFIFELKEQE